LFGLDTCRHAAQVSLLDLAPQHPCSASAPTQTATFAGICRRRAGVRPRSCGPFVQRSVTAGGHSSLRTCILPDTYKCALPLRLAGFAAQTNDKPPCLQRPPGPVVRFLRVGGRAVLLPSGPLVRGIATVADRSAAIFFEVFLAYLLYYWELAVKHFFGPCRAVRSGAGAAAPLGLAVRPAAGIAEPPRGRGGTVDATDLNA
jgi:hypothetical protein